MNTTENKINFDLVRLSKAKSTVDICPNTIRDYSRRGLRLYRLGKCVFFSKDELAEFIRAQSILTPYSARG